LTATKGLQRLQQGDTPYALPDGTQPHIVDSGVQKMEWIFTRRGRSGKGTVADPGSAGQGVFIGSNQARGREIGRRTGADAVGIATPEFIYEQPTVGDIEYQFKHALTQEVAYDPVLTERRRMLHKCAGQATEELFGDRLEDHLTELAHHFDRGGNVPKR
jgi:hypothetical protein